MPSLRALALVILVCASSRAGASVESWAIEQVYSNADGTVQYIVLHEAMGVDGAHTLTGQTLRTTRNGVTKTYTFGLDLPDAATAGRRTLIATQAMAGLHRVTPDYVMPDRFLPTDQGAVEYPGGKSVLGYASLPTDGISALFANQTTGPNIATNFAGQTASVPAGLITVVEFRNAALDHYFISPLAPDIDALDSGLFKGWARTGFSFPALPSEASTGAGVNPVCRFYIPPQHGDSHFFSASPAECAAILKKIATDPNYSGYVYETPHAFAIALPDTATGACPAGTIPVWRLWNRRADSNHRFATDPVVKAGMLAKGYVAEGYGPDAVSMCASGNPRPAPLFRASAASPFAQGCDGVEATGTLYQNAEVEPMVAVNSVNPDNIVGVWQQDRWSNGGAHGLLTGVSLDGGRTWTRTAAAFSRCAGGTAANGGDYERASDPWVTFAPDGTAHQSSLSFIGQENQPGSASAVLASRSTDGGRTWSIPATLIRDGPDAFNDKDAITADPTDARYVYATWDRLAGDRGPTWFARTTNGGVSWEPAKAIYDPGVNAQTLNNQIVVLPDGTLVDFFTLFNPKPSLAVIRSSDKGASWSAPITIAQVQALGAKDPETGEDVRDSATLGSIAVGPQGALAVVWQDARFSSGARDGIALARSADGGSTWTAPVRINADAGVQAFSPSVAIRGDGTIGITYYDFRNNTADPTTLPTDVWFTGSSDGATWHETHLSGPFDLAIAPDAEGLFLGDYHALTSIGESFVPFFVQTNNGSPENRTDVFASLVNATATSAANAKAVPEASREVRAAAAPPLAPTPELERALRATIDRVLARRLRGHGGSVPQPDARPDLP
jgi:hypothetical protein